MLSNYRLKVESVTLSDGTEVVVRGLSLADIMTAYEKHQSDMEAAFVALQDKNMSSADKMQLFMKAVQEFPSLTASLLASAANEPEHSDIVLLMPIGDQLTLADAVYGLTATAGLTLKNLSRALASLPTTIQQNKPAKKPSPAQRELPPRPAAN